MPVARGVRRIDSHRQARTSATYLRGLTLRALRFRSQQLQFRLLLRLALRQRLVGIGFRGGVAGDGSGHEGEPNRHAGEPCVLSYDLERKGGPEQERMRTPQARTALRRMF